MKYLFIVCLCVLISCSLRHKDGEYFRLYQIYDMEELLQDYYTNDLKRISPGIACGDFKMENKVGCFKLLIDKRHGKVAKLIYHDLSNGEQLEVYKISPPVDYVFIEKIYDVKLETSKTISEYEEVILEAGQPSLKLVFFEKSAVVFYWRNNAFHKIWIAD